MAQNPYDQFDQSATSAVKDTAVSFAQGANGLLKAVGDIYGLTTGDMQNPVVQLAQDNIDYLQRQKSPETLELEKIRKSATDAETGIIDKAAAYLKHTAPEWRLVLNDIAAAAPSLVGSGGVGAGVRGVASKLGASAATAAKAGVGAAIATGSGITAAQAGADQYAELVKTVKEMTPEQASMVPQIVSRMEKGDTLDEAKDALLLSMARDTAVLAGLASAATMLVPGGTTVERALVGGPAATATRGTFGQILASAAGEVTQETAENVSAELAKNVLARTVEPERPLSRGVGEAIGSSILPSAVMGGLGGASMRAEPTKPLSQSVQEGKPTAGIPGEPPAPAATREKLTETPQIDLTKVENLPEDQFWSAVDARQTMVTGTELPEFQRQQVAEAKMGQREIDPEAAKAATEGVNGVIEEWRKENPNAEGVEVATVFDPNMLHNGYGIRGAYNRGSKAVMLNAAFLQSPEMVKQVLNHEWAHHTLDTEEGRAALQDFARRSLPEGELEALAKQYNTNDPLVLVDEWIANNQEEAPGVLARMVNYVREWLAKIGIVDLDHDEVARILLRTLRQEATGRVDPVTEREPGPEQRMSLTEDAAENWYERREQQASSIAKDFVASKGKNKTFWKPLDPEKVAKIWLEYGKRGSISDAEGMQKIADQMVDLIARLEVANAVNGHDSYDIRPDFSDWGFDFTDKQWEKFVESMETTDGQALISDYGLPPLKILASKILTADTPEQQLLLVDRALNIVHQRSDLASLFIKGGTSSLDRISSQGGYQTPLSGTEKLSDQARLYREATRFSLTEDRPENLKKWAEGSKVVDEQGNPIRMYHGTRERTQFNLRTGDLETTGQDFTTFKPDLNGLIFASPSPNFANLFASGENTKARIYPVFVRAKNPFDYENPVHIDDIFGENQTVIGEARSGRPVEVYKNAVQEGDWVSIEQLANRIKKLGYDGLYVNEEGEKNLAVFDPTQIKSATGNVGAYGQRPVTAEEAGRLGMTEQEANEAQKQGDIRMSLTKDPLGFYSQLERTLEAIPPKASRQQIEAALRDGVKEKGQLIQRPVKKEEMEDLKDSTGKSFVEWLRENPNATRDQMLDFAREGQVRLQEQSLSGDENQWEVFIDGEPVDESFGSRRQAIDYVDGILESLRQEYRYDDGKLKDPSGEVIRTIEKRPEGYAILDNLGEEVDHYRTEPGAINALDSYVDRLIRDEYDRYSVTENESATKYGEYTLPNGKNYRELILTYPSDYVSSHFKGVEDYLAHVRVTDHETPDGKKVLFAEEIQSDLHQAGREKGYKTETKQQKIDRLNQIAAYREKADQLSNEITVLNDDISAERDQAKYDQLWEELKRKRDEREQIFQAIDQLSVTESQKVPNVPFKKTWHELAFKYLLQQAALTGSDFLAWTTGKQQGDRYNLSKEVRNLEWDQSGDNKIVSIRPERGETMEFAVEPDGTISTPGGRSYAGQFEGKNIAEVVGKDLGNQILAEPKGYRSGEGLAVGGEGMKGFYDRIVPQFAEKYLKKYGVKPEDIPIVTSEKQEFESPIAGDESAVEMPAFAIDVHAVRITPEMRRDFLDQGQSRYSLTPTNVSSSKVSRRELGLPEGKVSIQEVAKALNEFSKGKLGEGKFDDETVAVAHGILNAVAEGRNQLLLGEKSGADWYDTDIANAKKMIRKAIPTIKSDTDMVLFTALMTPTSFGQNPVENLRSAVRIYQHALDRGDDVWGNLAPRQDDGKGWTMRSTAVEMAIDRFNNLVNDRGERGAANWLLQKHPVSELRQYNPNVTGKAEDMKYGAYIFGPKGGPFFLNMNGIKEEMTKDLWWSRTFNRWFGTMEDTSISPEDRKVMSEEGMVDESTGKPDTGGFQIRETPRSLAERRRMDQIAKGAADELGLTIEELQATLWYYEQQLWKRLGARVESFSFSDGARKVLVERGIEPPRIRRSDSPSERRRQAAYALARDVSGGKTAQPPSD